ncbi:MAG: response regulator [Candidatus Obscuribacterales bacterium]|nr:response regulator [Candidatus Obscuribacterales bacterium]
MVPVSLMHKILIVEDDEFLADLMLDCLAASNYEVRAVGTGEDALRELETGSFHVVLLDWQLPDMEGLQVLKQYRSQNGAAKVIMLTGMRGRKEDGIGSGADRFLMKPFKIDDILATVREIVPDF